MTPPQPKKRKVRLPTLQTPPELRPAEDIAAEIMPDLPSDISTKVRAIASNPQEYRGDFGAALEAVYQIVRARLDGWMWTDTGGMPADPPESGAQTPIPLPAWAVEAIATGWQRFSRKEPRVALGTAFEVDATAESPLHYQEIMRDKLVAAGRTIQAADARSRADRPISDERMADALGVSPKTVSRDKRKYGARVGLVFKSSDAKNRTRGR